MLKPKKDTVRREKTIREFRGGLAEQREDEGETGVLQEMNKLTEMQKTSSGSLDHKLAAGLKIKQMEEAGIFSQKDIDSEKKKLGLSVDEKPLSKYEQISAKDLLVQELQTETDADARRELIQLIGIAESLEKQGNAQLAYNLAARPRTTGSKKGTLEEKLIDKMADHLFKEKKDDVDVLDKMMDLNKKFQDMQERPEGLDEVLEKIEKFKKAGLVRDPAQTETEMKMQVEKMKIDNEYKIEEQKIEADKERTKSLSGVVGDVISSALTAAGAAAGKGATKQTIQSPTGQQIKSETLDNAYETTCGVQDCGAKILVTNVDQERDIKCSACGAIYHINTAKKELNLVSQGPAQTSHPPV